MMRPLLSDVRAIFSPSPGRPSTSSWPTSTSSSTIEHVGEPRRPSFFSILSTCQPPRTRNARDALLGAREDGHHVGDVGLGDEALAAVQAPAGVGARGARAHRGGVGAGVGLGQRERAQPLAAGQPRQQLGLLRVGAEQQHRAGAEVLVAEQHPAVGAAARDLLADEREREQAAVEPAVLGRGDGGEDVVRAEQLAHVVRELAARVDLRGARLEVVLGELAHALRDLVHALAAPA